MAGFADWAGLKFRPEKCATLAVEYGSNSQRVVPTDPFLCQGNALPVLTWYERYKYLGKNLGGECAESLDKTKEQFLKDLEKVMSSSLAPWQKLLAFKVFLRPRFEYHLRVGAISKTWAKTVDLEVRRWLRIGLGLSKNTNQHLFYTSTDTGGLGIFELSRDVDAALVSTAIRMLNSRDSFVRKVACAGLRDACAKRTGNDAASFPTSFGWLSLPPGSGEAARGDITSFWVKVRNAKHNLGPLVSLAAPDSNFPPRLLVQGSERAPAGIRLLRSKFAEIHLQQLSSLKDQGKTASSCTMARELNSWLGNSAGLRDREWRFALNVCTNSLPVRAVHAKHRGYSGNKACPRCGFHSETLPHVLNHCPYMMWEGPGQNPILGRHDTILNIVLKDANIPENAEVFKDQQLPGYSSDPLLRPDLVVVDHGRKRAVIADVACPFESSLPALQKACDTKRTKYDGIKKNFEARGYTVVLDALVVECRGSYNIWKRRCLAESSVHS